MALNKQILKSDIKTMLNELKNELDQDDAIENYATKLSDAIDDYVRQAVVVGNSASGGPINGSLQ